VSPNLDRAWALYQRSRNDLAEELLHRELANDPNNPTAHSYLALCLYGREQHEEATQEAELAIRLAPDFAYAQNGLAWILCRGGSLKEAQAAIEEAIRLDPENAAYLAQLSVIEYDQSHWSNALAAADRGLRIAPEHILCANLRAMALMQLGRRKEAETTIENTLTVDPENALTHTIRGWLCLKRSNLRGRRSNISGALGSFREALRLNPQDEWARQGYVEALKTRLRRWLFWGWLFLILGGGALLLVMDVVDGSLPFSWLWVAATVYLLVVLSFMAGTLFTLVLRLHPSWRSVLLPTSRTSAILGGVYFLIAFVLLAGVLWSGNWLIILVVGLISALFLRLADQAWGGRYRK
jgi:Tfp pilus assembly protein PilF